MTIPRSALTALVVVMLVGLLIPTVSAGIIYDENFDEYEFTGGRTVIQGASNDRNGALSTLEVDDIADLQELQYIALEWDGNVVITANWPEGTHEITYTTSYNSTPKPAILRTTYYRNLLGNVIYVKNIFYFHDWDIEDATGKAYIYIPPKTVPLANVISREGDSPVSTTTVPGKNVITVASGKIFKNHLVVSDNKPLNNLNVKLTRIIDGKSFASTLTVYSGEEIVYNDYSARNVDEDFLLDRTTLITLANGDKIYEYPIGASDTPDTNAITVYVKNSQTGALLAGSHIIISASVGGEFHEVVNQTLPGGTATYTLQPTGGGLPNPDYYRLIATADGYNPYMPYIDFELDRPTNLIVMMEPITGGPADENKTFIEFYVRDLSGNGISDASVTCGGYALITNSAGYTQFEMPKNAIYPYTVRKSGYVTIEGTATVGDGPRYTVNVVLGPKEIPTNPPATDPGGPGATPTPDRRTNEEKGQAVIDMIADNAEGIGALALICLLMGLLKLMAKW